MISDAGDDGTLVAGIAPGTGRAGKHQQEDGQDGTRGTMGGRKHGRESSSGPPDRASHAWGLISRPVRPPSKGWLAALAAVAIGLAACRGDGAGPPGRAQARPTGVKVLLVGMDAADWQLAGPLADAGRMPHLASLRSRGAWGTVRSLVPVLSPLLWTSVATGRTADVHGVIDFLVPDPATGRRTPVQSGARRAPALWDHFTAWSRTSDIVAWWATWPAEPLAGRLVSDRLAYSLFGIEPPGSGARLTWPPELLESIRPLVVRDADISYDDIRRFLDIAPEEFAAARARLLEGEAEAQRHPVGHLIRILAATRTYHAVALSLLRSGQADLTAVYYQGIDEVCHRFIHFAPPALPGIDREDVKKYGRAVEAFYEYQDTLLGELVAAVDDSTVVMVISDHGFLNGPDRPAGKTADIEGQPARWHRRHGLLLMAGGPVRAGRLETASLLDVAPTILALSGLPIPDTMTGRVLAVALEPRFLVEHPESRLAEAAFPPLRTAAAVGAAEAGAPQEDPGAEEMMAALRSLGYIGAGEQRSAAAKAPTPAGGSTVPDTLTAHANMAGTHLAAGDLKRAEAEIDAALRLAPGAPQARLLLFDLRMRQRRFDEAITVGETLLAGDPDIPGDLFLARLAAAWREAGKLDEGIRRFEGEIRRGRWKTGSALARLLREAGRPREAEEAASAVLSRDPLDESAMAVLVHLRQDAAAASGSGGASRPLAPLEPALDRALRLNPRSIMHLNWMALVRMEAGDAEAASALLESALDVNPDHPATMANLGAVHLRERRPDLALPVLVRAVELNPASIEARVNLGTAWAQQRRYPEAIREFETAWKAGYRRPSVALALARAWGEMGHADAARHWQQEAAGGEKSD
jgi:predicted AlkP superfamily phosphohydrolase/phosphomutase/tetratricopeptide (TPR) repeat protein